MKRSRSILIVEDEPLIAMMLEDFLESLGHRVVASCDSVTYLNFATAPAPSISAARYSTTGTVCRRSSPA